jgi:protein-disulfide isomerase
MAVDHIKVEGGHRSGVEAAPALFINGSRCTDCQNVEQLIAVIVATSD